MTNRPKNIIDLRDLMPIDEKCQILLELHEARKQVRVLLDRVEYLQYRLELNDEKFGSIDYNKLYEAKEQEEKYR